MVLTSFRSITFLAFYIGNSILFCASLDETVPLDRFIDVEQFGMPSDAKYIICDTKDCPKRTPKHITSDLIPGNSIQLNGGEDQYKIISLSTVTLFDFDSAVLRYDGIAHLDSLISDFSAYPQSGTVRIIGHTDSIGDSAYNQSLSERRAISVRDYLVANGLDFSNIVALGKGENSPIAKNNTAAGRRKNRRVEIIIPVFHSISARSEDGG